MSVQGSRRTSFLEGQDARYKKDLRPSVNNQETSQSIGLRDGGARAKTVELYFISIHTQDFGSSFICPIEIPGTGNWQKVKSKWIKITLENQGPVTAPNYVPVLVSYCSLKHELQFRQHDVIKYIKRRATPADKPDQESSLRML